MPSHALPPGTEARIRRRARRHEAFRQLRDWRTWGLIGACVVGLSLSEGMVSHLWPKAHGAGYVITRVVACAVLGGVIAALLVAVVVILTGAVRDRSLNPKLLGGGVSPTALTWAFASSVAKSSGYMLTSANVIMVSGHGHGFSVQKNHVLISVLAGQGKSIYAELQ